MKLIVKNINSIVVILSSLKLNKVLDKDSKLILLKDYIALRKIAQDFNFKKDEIIQKFQKDWIEEIEIINSLRRKNESIVGHKEYLQAEKDANKLIDDIFSEEVEVNISSVKIDVFTNFSEDITLEQIALLQECGIIE